MDWKVDRVPAEEFAGLWNAAASLDDVVARVRERVGAGPVPRWTVLARAAACRKAGLQLKPLEVVAKAG